jgi:agmatinase
MSLPVEYQHGDPLAFGGVKPETRSYEDSKVVVLPVPFDRTTSYVPGTRNGPREILQASSHMELWDEELNIDVHGVGIFTLPEMELPFSEMDRALGEIRRVTAAILERDKFPVVLGGEHSITAPVVAAAAAKYPGLSVLQLDAHADLRDSYMGSRFNHACAMRRVLEYARCTQVGIRSMSPEEAQVVETLPTEIFYDITMRQTEDWIEQVVESLAETVYVTIDCDGLDPAIMPAVGTPEPGGFTWYEVLGLMRRVVERRRVVGLDVVELCPIPGLVAPNFLCAKLVYKMLTYRFAKEIVSV